MLLIVMWLLFLGLAVAQTPPASGLPSAPSQFQIAVEHLQKGRLSAAEPILLRLAKSTPNDPQVNEALGMLYSLRGQHQRAIAYLDKAVRLKPSPQGYAGLGAGLAELGREDEAIAAFRKALSLDPHHLPANFNLAGMYMRRNEFALAAPLLERVVKSQPGLPEPSYLLALCYSATNRPAQARTTLLALPAKARDREDLQILLGSAALSEGKRTEARAHFERAIRLNPESVQGAANLGAMLVSSGEAQRGLELLEGAWKKDKTSYLAGYNLALAYQKTGKLEAARGVLADLLTKGETGEIYNLLGEIEAGLKNQDAALPYLARAAELNPSEPNLFDWGYRSLLAWKLDQAAAAFQRGSEKYPKSARLWLGLGSALFAQAKNEEAASAYLRATELGEDPRAYRLLGNVYMTLKNPRADVAARFHRYRESHPRNAWANFYDAYSLIRAGDEQQAWPLLQQALELDPKLAEAHFEIGNLYAAQGKTDDALSAYQAAVKNNPQYQQAYYRMGQLLARAGRQEEADAALKRHEELRKQEEAGLQARMLELLKEKPSNP